MWRNIFGHGIYQIIVLLILLFFGKDWFGFTYTDDTPLVTTTAWIEANPNSGYSENEMTQKTHLYTIVFQSFVFMQLFNQINARKLGARDFNIFAGFFNNWLFLFITVITFAVQYAMVEFAGRFATVVPLTLRENGICLAIGSGSLIWGLIIKLIMPPKMFRCLTISEKPMTDEEEKVSFVTSMRRSMRQSTVRASADVHAVG